MHLFDIPVEILVELFTKYLTIQDISVVDVATCNDKVRPLFLEVLSHPDCVLMDCKILTKQKLAWLLARNACVNRLELRKVIWNEKDFEDKNFLKIASKVRILVVDGSSNILPCDIFLRCFEGEEEQLLPPCPSRERSRSHGHTPRNLVRKRHKQLKKSASLSNKSTDEISNCINEKLQLNPTFFGSNEENDDDPMQPDSLLAPDECLSPMSPHSIADSDTMSPHSHFRYEEPAKKVGFQCLEELHLTGFKKLFPQLTTSVAASSPTKQPSSSPNKGVVDKKKKSHSPEGLVRLFNEYCNSSNVRIMNFSGCWDITDTILHGIVQKHSGSLCSLSTSACFQLSNEGLEALFTLPFPNLCDLNLSLCGQLSTLGLRRVIRQVHATLESLILTGCVGLTEDATFYIQSHTPYLRVLDLGGIKNINDMSISYLNGNLQPTQLIDDEEYRVPEPPKNAMQLFAPRRFYVDHGDVPPRPSLPSTSPLANVRIEPLPLESIVLEGCVNVSLPSLKQLVEIHAATLKKLDMRYCSYSVAPTEMSETNPLALFLSEVSYAAPALSVVLTRT